jgi:hypothetical protein
MSVSMRDPTAEIGSQRRPRTPPPASLEGATVALLDIGKLRGSEYIDRLQARLSERGITSKRYRKATPSRVAPTALLQQIAAEARVAVIALSD